MKQGNGEGCWIALGGLFVSCLIAGACAAFCSHGWNHGAAAEQRKAVEAGAGRWVVDGRTGERSFEYGSGKP